MSDVEVAVGARRTYPEGRHRGDGKDHLHATSLGGTRLAATLALNVITTLSHWIT